MKDINKRALTESIMRKIRPIINRSLNEGYDAEMSDNFDGAIERYMNEWFYDNRKDSMSLAYIVAIVYDRGNKPREDVAFELAEMILNDFAKYTGEPYDDEFFINQLQGILLRDAEDILKVYLEYNLN